ncbi:amino acid adenylation domain-containing protein [Paenibacillus zeisoli]|uniref:Amino acid adenylation domain-containing protein n=1 Tax=Paenibacillus zeisoli TaxID=2496267 RepID=A0A3S1BBG1_9BACL|nr:non-ribosomal peptide synthetase [Paenibacillus zeisoli]RUT36532.1 amino acid adenylation domain-containing protein [Paenibacillus zeisoli]
MTNIYLPKKGTTPPSSEPIAPSRTILSNDVHVIDLPEQLVSRLFAVSRDSDAALFMVMLAGTMYLLSRYSGDRSITAAFPEFTVQGQVQRHKQQAIEVSASLQGEEAFKDWLKHVQGQASEATSASVFSSKGEPLKSALIFMDTLHGDNAADFAYSDLAFGLYRQSGQLKLRIHYSLDVYTEQRIAQMAEHWLSLIQQALQEPGRPMRELDFVSEDERHRMLVTYIDTEREFNKEGLLHQYLELQALRNPGRTALLCGEEKLSYECLNQRANQLARHLVAFGVKPDQPVAIMAQRSLQMIIGIMAILKAGGAYVPIDPAHPKERIRHLLEDSGAAWVLAAQDGLESIRGLCTDRVVLDLEDSALYQYDNSNLNVEVTSSNLAYVIYTSGSTGKPKGVMVEHRSVINRLQWMQNQYPLSEDDVILQKTPVTFDVSVWELFWWCMAGASLCLLEPGGEKDPEEILQAIDAYQVTTMHFVPSMLSLFLDHLERNERVHAAASLRRVFASGEALQVQQVQRFERLIHRSSGTDLVNLYGPTEATVDVSYYDCLGAELTHTVPIGRPIDNIRLYILDADDRLQPEGVIGELCISGEGLARGYWNQPELTGQKFVANPFEPGKLMYRTGDLACWLPDGTMEYAGRIDHQVKIRGQRMECGEIEYHLLNHPDIREAIVTAHRDDAGDSYLCAYIVSDQALTSDQVQLFLSDQLPAYMIPAHLVRLDHIPLTPNGKADRAALPRPGKVQLAHTEHVSPADDMERTIVRLWSAELALTSSGVEDSFFMLGGDSIKVIRLISQVNQEFQVHVKSRDFYANPTIRGLAQLVRNHQEVDGVHERQAGLASIERLHASILGDPDQAKALPRDWTDLYPLSNIQQSMVFYSRMRPDEPMYHDQFCYQFSSRVFDLQRFGHALSLMISKHPILRTTIHLSAFREAVQIVHQDMEPELVYEDISAQTKQEQERYLHAYLDVDLKLKYKFENDRLWRTRLYRVDDSDYCLIISFHHAILDGWSVASLIAELVDTYSRLIEGEVVAPEPLQASYKDYVAIQMSRVASEESRSYWNNRLADYSRNKLPFNFTSRKMDDVPAGKIIRERLEPSLLQGLERKAKELGCTLMEVCFAAHLYLLGLLTTEQDIVTGLVTHDRPDVMDSEKVLGCFLNTVPFRTRVEKKLNKNDFIAKIRSLLGEAKPHEMFLADIAAAVGEGGQRDNPFFDTLFNFIDMHVLEKMEVSEDRPIGPSSNEIKLNANEMTNTLFDLEVSRTLHQLHIQLKYSPNYFHDNEMRTAFEIYVRVLEKFADHEDTIQAADCLLASQIERTVVEFNRTEADYPRVMTLHQLFTAQAERTPNQVALRFEDQEMTYRELDHASNRIARLLVSNGIGSGDHVGLRVGRGFEMVVSMLGILKCGAAYVPIDPEFPQNRIAYIMENAQISVVLTDHPLEGVQEAQCILLQEIADSEEFSSEAIDIVLDSSELAYVIYTSGSTGMPKGVMIAHHAAVNLIHWVNETFHVSDQDRLLFITSMCFDLSVYDVFGMLAAGGQIVIAKKEQVQSPAQLRRLMAEEGITFWDSVPSTMNHLVQHVEQIEPDLRNETLRLVFMSGDWIPVQLPERIRTIFPNAQVISLGGATEATVWSNYYPVEQISAYQASIPYGKPLANNYFYILDDDCNPVPEGVAGELYIGGVGVAKGYMNDPERTERSFMPNPFLPGEAERMYRTGDLGRLLPDGNMEFLGRKDYQVKIRGYRVELGEIESQLCKLPSILEACVIDLTDQEGNKFLCAYYAAAQEIPVSEIKNQLAEVLPGYMVPSMFMQIPQLPLTPNGKINRKGLPEPKAVFTVNEHTYVPPRHELDEKLIGMWKSVLNVADVGIQDNFFEVGGHSLLAVKLELEVEKYAKVPMDMFVYNFQTIEEQSDFLIANGGHDLT